MTENTLALAREYIDKASAAMRLATERIYELEAENESLRAELDALRAATGYTRAEPLDPRRGEEEIAENE